MTRSSRIIIIFVVIALMLGIGCLFFVDFSGGAQNLQNAQKNTVTEVENDAPGNKKVPEDDWWVIDGCLKIFSDTELKKKSKLVVPAVYEGEKVRSLDVTCSEGTFSNYLTYVEIEEGIETIEYGFVSCPNLKTVIIPDSVTSISGDAFADCTALHNITIPAGVASIGEYALGYSYDVSGADTNYIPIEGFTIYGYAGTAAETYANKNSFNFVDLTDPEIAIIPEKTDEIYVRGSGKDAVIYCTGEFADFVSVEMDGEMVDPSNYKVTEGSTVLTFVASYLDTLSVGRHTVTLNYIDTSISTFLTIVEENGGNSTLTGDGTGNNTNAGNGTNTGSANKTDSAVQTGDQSNIVLLVVLGVCSLVVCTVALTKRKRYEM